MGGLEIIESEHREKTYKFYAGLCLRPPSDSLVEMIKDGSLLFVFRGNAEDGIGFNWLSDFIRQADKIPNLKEELEAEHTALFVLPSGILPHESVYVSKEMRLGGSVTADVKRCYEEAGAAILESCIEMPDHFGIELEFMGFLCNLEKQLWETPGSPMLNKCIALQKTFLEAHLSKWADACCRQVIRRATYGFYRAVMHFIMQFLHSEAENIAVRPAAARTKQAGKDSQDA